MIHGMIHGTKERKRKSGKKKEYMKFRFENKNLINEELLYTICFYRNILMVLWFFKLLRKNKIRKKLYYLFNSLSIQTFFIKH